MRIGIIGGTGFLGKQLSQHILLHTDWDVTVISHRGGTFTVDKKFSKRISFVTGNVLDTQSITTALTDINVAYYFVHMMGQKKGNFYELELQAAHSFVAAINNSSVQRVIYMGGLGNQSDALSDHLKSRQRTGKILRSLTIDVIEFQASMIVAPGSVAFDIIANLVNTLPIMVLPRSAKTLTQPIALADALTYLRQAATVPISQNQVIQIGGPDVLSYEEIYKMYADLHPKRRLVIRVPVVPAWLEAKFLDYFTPTVHARIGKAMVESLGNEMVVTSDTATSAFPDVTPQPIASALAESM